VGRAVTTEALLTDTAREDAIARLEPWQDTVDPCEHGHVEHGPEAHLGRRIVHSFSGTMGADWDYEAVVDFIRAADDIRVLTKGLAHGMGHSLAVHSAGRWIAFETREDRR
jgi:hypothetical protein